MAGRLGSRLDRLGAQLHPVYPASATEIAARSTAFDWAGFHHVWDSFMDEHMAGMSDAAAATLIAEWAAWYRRHGT